MQLLQRLHNGAVSTGSHCLHMLALVIPDVHKHIIQSAATKPTISPLTACVQKRQTAVWHIIYAASHAHSLCW